MNPAAALQAFASIFPAELPDKTMIACIVLVSRHRRRAAVFTGVAAAFALHVGLAVVAGSALSRLPARPVALATALVFGAGAVVLWRSTAHDARPVPAMAGASAPLSPSHVGPSETPAAGRWTVVLASFAVVGVAEFGDLTQLATAGLAVRTGAPLEVAIGSLAALCTVAALAILVGQRLVARLRVETLQRMAAALFAVLAVVTVVEAF